MLCEPETERLDVLDVILARERIHGVLHRVGRQTRSVVAVDVHRLERTLERHVEGEIDDLVRIPGAPHLHEPHARLAVAVPGQSRHDPESSSFASLRRMIFRCSSAARRSSSADRCEPPFENREHFLGAFAGSATMKR